MKPHRHKGFVLVTTLLLITLLIAVAAELATSTSIGALVARRRLQSVAHDIAVDSTLLVIKEHLQPTGDGPVPLVVALDRDGQAVGTFVLGDVHVRWVIRDDGIKFNPRVLQRDDQAHLLTRTLTRWAQDLNRRTQRVQLRPLAPRTTDRTAEQRYVWFDQLVADVHPGALFRWADDDPARPHAWSDVLTLWGDGRIALRRVSPHMLDLALADIRPGLGRKLLSKRGASGGDVVQDALAAMDSEVRERIMARITYDTERYAIYIDTTIAGHTRRWYVVATMSNDGLTVLHRSPVTW